MTHETAIADKKKFIEAVQKNKRVEGILDYGSTTHQAMYVPKYSDKNLIVLTDNGIDPNSIKAASGLELDVLAAFEGAPYTQLEGDGFQVKVMSTQTFRDALKNGKTYALCAFNGGYAAYERGPTVGIFEEIRSDLEKGNMQITDVDTVQFELGEIGAHLTYAFENYYADEDFDSGYIFHKCKKTILALGTLALFVKSKNLVFGVNEMYKHAGPGFSKIIEEFQNASQGALLNEPRSGVFVDNDHAGIALQKTEYLVSSFLHDIHKELGAPEEFMPQLHPRKGEYHSCNRLLHYIQDDVGVSIERVYGSMYNFQRMVHVTAFDGADNKLYSGVLCLTKNTAGDIFGNPDQAFQLSEIEEDRREEVIDLVRGYSS